jgi:hypothetical protein
MSQIKYNKKNNLLNISQSKALCKEILNLPEKFKQSTESYVIWFSSCQSECEVANSVVAFIIRIVLLSFILLLLFCHIFSFLYFLLLFFW